MYSRKKISSYSSDDDEPYSNDKLQLAEQYASNIKNYHENSDAAFKLGKLWIEAIEKNDINFIKNAPLSYKAMTYDEGLKKIIQKNDEEILDIILSRYEIKNDDDYFITLMEEAIKLQKLHLIEYLSEYDDRKYEGYTEIAASHGAIRSLDLLIDLEYPIDYFLIGDSVGSGNIEYAEDIELYLLDKFGYGSAQIYEYETGLAMTAPLEFLIESKIINITPIQASFRNDNDKLLRTFKISSYPTPELYREFINTGSIIRFTGARVHKYCDKECIDQSYLRYVDLLQYQHPYDPTIERSGYDSMR
jgi:hypothetical protein